MFGFKHFFALSAALLLLAADATAQTGTNASAATGEKEKIVSGNMKLLLRNKLELSGTPVDLEAIDMNSLFGNAKIPLHTIAGIRFAQGGNEQTTVVLLNGDALTGDINLSDVDIVSEWGEAKVNVAHLVSIVFRHDLAWSAVATPNGKRWRLTKMQSRAGPPVYAGAQGRPIYNRP